MHGRLLLFLMTGALLVPAITAAGDDLRGENYSFPAADAKTAALRDIRGAELVYRGVPGARTFTFRVVDRESRYDRRRARKTPLLTLVRQGDVMEFRLSKPDGSWHGSKAHDRPVLLEVTGPEAMNVAIDCDHSDVRVQHTSGVLSLSGDNGDIAVLDHNGRLRISSKYGIVTGEGLRGGFDVECSFGQVTLAVADQREDSRLDVSFGKARLNLPRHAGAEFHLSEHSGDITFKTEGRFMFAEAGSRRILNGGGPSVRLSAKLARIEVAEGAPSGEIRNEPGIGGVIPLSSGTWWRYTGVGDTLTLRVAAVRTEFGQTIATLAFDDPDSAPFGSIDVYESEEGLFLYGINRGFFGRDLTGIILNPPRLWFPYDANAQPVSGDDLTGSVRIAASPDSVRTPAGDFSGVITYLFERAGAPGHRIQIAPGFGFISFDKAVLAGSSTGEISVSSEPASPLPDSVAVAPEVPTGPLRSIDIIGNRVRSDRYLRHRLNITEGQTYSREEIDVAVERLRDDPLIDYVSFDFGPDGELRIYVYEKRPFTADFGIVGSFTRVSGFGLGPSLKLSSAAAPISDLEGYARYDWQADRHWSGGVTVSRRLFSNNPLVIGAGYRDDFGSNMDWAIPPDDARLNAFFFGRSVENYFREASSSGFISQSLGNRLTLRAEYFESQYSSVEKETNWSLFDRGDTKRDNPALSPASAGYITGTRLSLNVRRMTSIMDFRGRFEMERTYQGHSGAYPAYTRLLGYGAWNMRYWYGHLVKFRLVGGYSPHDLPDQRSFQLGGHNTLRGYDVLSVPAGVSPDSSYDGGDRMFLMNFDYFYGEGTSIIFFGDLGGVWRTGESVTTDGLRRDLGIGLAFGSDFFSSVDGEHNAGFRINWATPVGPVSHQSYWTVNFVRAY